MNHLAHEVINLLFTNKNVLTQIASFYKVTKESLVCSILEGTMNIAMFEGILKELGITPREYLYNIEGSYNNIIHGNNNSINVITQKPSVTLIRVDEDAEVLSQNHRFIYANQEYCELMKAPFNKIVGCSIWSFSSPIQLGGSKRIDESMRLSNYKTFEISQWLHVDSEGRLFESYISGEKLNT